MPVPNQILQVRKKYNGHRTVTEVLVQWDGLTESESSWITLQSLQRQYPELSLEVKAKSSKGV